MTVNSGIEHEVHEGHEEHEGVQPPRLGLEPLASLVVDAGLAVHRALGPGLLESTYEHCLAHELETRSVSIRRRVSLPVAYKGVRLDAGYRIDLLIDDRIVVEIKAVDALTRLHEAQLLTYLRLSGRRLGFLMNFNVYLFKDGIRRFAL